MRAAVLVIALLALSGCGRNAAPKVSCTALRQTFDRAFAQAVQAGAARQFEEQKRYMHEGERASLAMEDQGCCAVAGACPALNVH